jgi:hypothetical protein
MGMKRTTQLLLMSNNIKHNTSNRQKIKLLDTRINTEEYYHATYYNIIQEPYT